MKIVSIHDMDRRDGLHHWVVLAGKHPTRDIVYLIDGNYPSKVFEAAIVGTRDGMGIKLPQTLRNMYNDLDVAVVLDVIDIRWSNHQSRRRDLETPPVRQPVPRTDYERNRPQNDRYDSSRNLTDEESARLINALSETLQLLRDRFP